MDQFILIVLLTFLVIIALAIVRIQELLTVIMLLSLYSLVSASIFVIMDAVDVAFTEAAVGVGISTLLLLGVLAMTTSRQNAPRSRNLAPLIVVLITGAALIYGTLDMPRYGDPNAPAHQHVAPRYINVSGEEIGVPNMVTSVLASYRGYDTLGEVVVIFTASITVLSLLGRSRKK